MTTSLKPTEIKFCPTGSEISLSGAESGGWAVEMNAAVGWAETPGRVRFDFSGVVQLRINDPRDSEHNPKRPLSVIESSSWVQQFLADYITQFDSSLLPAVKNVKHYLVTGHDLQVALLAREVTITQVKVEG